MRMNQTPDTNANTPGIGKPFPTLVRLREVIARTGLSRSTIYDRMSQGTFPSPVSLGGGRAVAWVESEVNDWIHARIKARDTRQGDYLE